jgi:hypothetical protein
MRLKQFRLGNNEYVNGGLERYIMYGIPPGGFLTSLLAHDLPMAKARADHWNSKNFERIVKEIRHSGLPPEAVGSYEAISDWSNDKDGVRTVYTRRINELRLFNRLSGAPYNGYILDPS